MKWLLSVFFFIPTIVLAQFNCDTINHIIFADDHQFIGVMKFNSISATDVYNHALHYLTLTTSNVNAAIEQQSLTGHFIVAELGYGDSHLKYSYNVKFSIDLRTKDNKLRYHISDINAFEIFKGLRTVGGIHLGLQPNKWQDNILPIPQWDQICTSIHIFIKEYLCGLNVHILDRTNADW